MDEEGYTEWLPKEQNDEIDEKRIEDVLGIRLREELKEFYSAYCFIELIGKISDEINIYFDKIPYGYNINDYIIGKHIDKCALREYGEVFEKYELFKLGSADKGGMDVRYVLIIIVEKFCLYMRWNNMYMS